MPNNTRQTIGIKERALYLKGRVDVYERYQTAKGWSRPVLTDSKDNLIVNVGYQTIVNSIFGFGTLGGIVFDTFGVSNGVLTPAVTDTSTTWDGDGTQYRKAVQSVTYDATSKTVQITCYLNSGENTVTSISKFALFDATGTGGNMFNDILFSSPKSKNSSIEIYFVYNFIMTETI